MPYDHSKSHFWNKEGQPIELMEWASLNHWGYKLVATEEFVTSDGRQVTVTTCWLGDNMEDELRGIGDNPAIDLDSAQYLPRIFGTMIWGGWERGAYNTEIRHRSLAEATERHNLIVDALKTGDPDLLKKLEELIEQDGV